MEHLWARMFCIISNEGRWQKSGSRIAALRYLLQDIVTSIPPSLPPGSAKAPLPYKMCIALFVFGIITFDALLFSRRNLSYFLSICHFRLGSDDGCEMDFPWAHVSFLCVAFAAFANFYYSLTCAIHFWTLLGVIFWILCTATNNIK